MLLWLRYQPERPSLVVASSPEEAELSDSNPSVNMLPGLEERFSFKTLLFPDNPEPSKLSGFTVNVCASVLGRPRFSWQKPGCPSALVVDDGNTRGSLAGLLILAFSVLAVQGGAAVWSIVALTAIFMVSLLLGFVIWRQPESKTKLSFKVGDVPLQVTRLVSVAALMAPFCL